VDEPHLFERSQDNWTSTADRNAFACLSLTERGREHVVHQTFPDVNRQLTLSTCPIHLCRATESGERYQPRSTEGPAQRHFFFWTYFYFLSHPRSIGAQLLLDGIVDLLGLVCL
jgi:hypothetical protein